MAQDGKNFADDIFSDPTRRQYEKSAVRSAKITFDTATEFDQEVIRKMEAYQTLERQMYLHDIAASAYVLAKEIQAKTGLTDIEVGFEPGRSRDEIAIRYKMGKRSLALNFPYLYRRHIFTMEGRFTQRTDEGIKKLLSGSVLGRYQLGLDTGLAHSLLVEKQWHDLYDIIDAALKVKYTNRWLDANARESCWTKQCKFMYDMNRSSVLFKHSEELRPPNYLYAKISHKARNNTVDPDKSSTDFCKSLAAPDGLLSFKVGHKTSYDAGKLSVLVKNSAELGHNQTDATFAKFRGTLQDYFNVWDWTLWHNSLAIEKIVPLTLGGIRLNDSPMLRGMKGVHDFPGAKTYRNPAAVAPGREYVGDRVGNEFVAQYETKLFFPNVSPFRYIPKEWPRFMPYLYGTVGYARPAGGEFAGNSLMDNMRASTGFGLSLRTAPVAVEFYYAVASVQPRCDKPNEFGFFLGVD